MVDSVHALKLLADGLALVYHEARHVRHLVRARHLEADSWACLLSLPTNRVEAWRAMLEVRKDAAAANTSDDAAHRFELRFRKTLADLEALYANSHWRHAAAFGGHAWRGVTASVVGLREAVASGKADEVEAAADALRTAKHNNGDVRHKIAELDETIGYETGQWWKQPTDA